MTDPKQGYPERDPYRPDPHGEQGPTPYGRGPGPQPHDDRYREQQFREEYGERYDDEPPRKGGAGKWVVLILLVIALLIGLFLWMNRDEGETADPLPEETTSAAGDEVTSPAEGGETEVVGDAVLPVVIEEWKLNTLVVPTYMRGLDAVSVIEGDSAPSELIGQLGEAMSETQEVSFGKCGVFDFERIDGAEFLKDLGAQPQACTLKVGETELIVVSIKGAELSDLVTIADGIDQR